MAQAPNVFKAYLAQKLAAGGSETTIYLDRITTVTGETITTSDFADFGRGILTVNPDGDGSRSYPEFISFTAVDSANVALTGATRGLSARSNSVVTDNKRFHPVGTPVVIAFGSHTLQDLVDYFENQLGAITVGTGTNTVATAGESVVAGDGVYLKDDGKWWKWDADTAATVQGVQLGIAQGSGSADGAITNGVLLRGRDTNQSGLSAGTTYYASNTAGGISSSAGTNPRIIGVGLSTTTLQFDPYYAPLPTYQQGLFLGGIVGMVLPFAGSAAPTGFLLCHGQAVSRTTYAALFAVISTTYGVGDGATTFNLPDLRGRIIAGLDNLGGSAANRITDSQADTLGGVFGAATHTLTTDEMPSHTHSYMINSGGAGSNTNIAHTTAASESATGDQINSTGGGSAHNNVQPTIFMSYIIKF